jgi:hypothetical protein
VFDRAVDHSSYRTSAMTRPRYSLDCRAVAKYQIRPDNRHYFGTLFESNAYPPPPPPPPPPKAPWPTPAALARSAIRGARHYAGRKLRKWGLRKPLPQPTA